MITFIEWLESKNLLESIVQRQRSALSDRDLKKVTIEVGDLVDLGPETKYKGKPILRLARVYGINDKVARVESLTDRTRFDIALELLHDIEELRGTGLIARDQEQLDHINGSKLWIKLNPRQYKKFKNRYKAPEQPEWMTKLENPPEKPSQSLIDLFKPDMKTPEVSPLDDMMKKTDASPPLRRFIKKDALNF